MEAAPQDAVPLLGVAHLHAVLLLVSLRVCLCVRGLCRCCGVAGAGLPVSPNDLVPAGDLTAFPAAKKKCVRRQWPGGCRRCAVWWRCPCRGVS